MRGKLKRTINVEASIEDEHEILRVDGVERDTKWNTEA